MIENVGVININPKSRGKSSRNDRECDEERTSSDKPTTPSVDDTTTTTAAVNSDVTPAEQPSRRVRRNVRRSKTAKPKKGKENLSSIFGFSLLTIIFVIICSSKGENQAKEATQAKEDQKAQNSCTQESPGL